MRSAGVKKYLNEKGFAVLKALDAAAKKHNANSTQVALAWLMQRKAITAPIVSATSLDQLKDLVAAPAIKLDPESVAAIDKVVRAVAADMRSMRADRKKMNPSGASAISYGSGICR